MSYSVRIPEEMRKKYVERRGNDVKELREAIAGRKVESFLRVGHQLKGNALTFGYDELTDLGKRIEAAGEAADFSAGEVCVDELEAWIKRQPV